jgi:glycine cleavage system transcriptional repressor
MGFLPSPTPSMQTNVKKYIVLSALGKDRPGIVNDLSKAILEAGCNIEDSRMTVLGGEFAVILLVSGTWNAVAKLEAMAANVAKKLELTISAKHTEPRALKPNAVPYLVDVVSMDHPGIVRDIAEFFSARAINIEDMSTWTYAAAHTGTPMFSLSMTISVPSDQHIGRLRSEFLDFCDDRNLDATLEPSRQ